MEYRRLGRTGYKISEIGHGLFGAGGGSWFGATDEEIRGSLQLSFDLGCNFFDSAYVYGTGKSDMFLGELIMNNSGKKIYAASKVPPKSMKWPASSAESYEESYPMDHVLRYTDTIRKSLGVETIDLLQFHTWDDSWSDNSEWHRTVKQLKDEKLANAVGISLNRFEPNNGVKAVKTGIVDAVQVVYNIFEQAPEDQLFEACREMDIGIIARVPLDEGGLTGTLTMDTKFDPNEYRSRYFSNGRLEQTVGRVEALKALLPASMDMPEMALRFVLSNPQVSTTIVGMRNSKHVKENFGYSDGVPLDSELLSELRKHRWDRPR